MATAGAYTLPAFCPTWSAARPAMCIGLEQQFCHWICAAAASVEVK
jgi:hypothetical protein